MRELEVVEYVMSRRPPNLRPESLSKKLFPNNGVDVYVAIKKVGRSNYVLGVVRRATRWRRLNSRLSLNGSFHLSPMSSKLLWLTRPAERLTTEWPRCSAKKLVGDLSWSLRAQR